MLPARETRRENFSCVREDRASRAAGEARSLEYSWEAINQVVADMYVRLIEERHALQLAEAAE